MQVSTSIQIDAPIERIWSIITDIKNADKNISAIESIKVLEEPNDDLIGLKWEETRIFMGKSATETMWISEAIENEFYQTEAVNHGMLYESFVTITENDGKHFLTLQFKGTPQTFGAKIMSFLMTPFFKKATIKAFGADLQDIKKLAESK